MRCARASPPRTKCEVEEVLEEDVHMKVKKLQRKNEHFLFETLEKLAKDENVVNTNTKNGHEMKTRYTSEATNQTSVSRKECYTVVIMW